MLSEAARKDPAMSGQVKYERRPDDLYQTEPENVDCLAHYIDLTKFVAWEPACGEGQISKRLASYGLPVISSDLRDRGFGTGNIDFLQSTKLPPVMNTFPNLRKAIITNPPFADMAEKFIRHALDLTERSGGMVAMFLRNEYDMSAEDRPDLFEGHPAYMLKVCVTKRPRWVKYKKGDKSPRHNYAWYVWDWEYAQDPRDGASIRYIHPKNAAPIIGSSNDR